MQTTLSVLSASFLFVAAGVGLIASVAISLRKYGNIRSNLLLSALMLVFSLALVRNGLLLLFNQDDLFHIEQIPLWYTFSIGPLLFFYVKLSVYPQYLLRYSDLKHFILPTIQFIFYWLSFFFSAFGNTTFSELYKMYHLKSIEGFLFLMSFFPYLILAFRYVKYDQAQLEGQEDFWKFRKNKWLSKILKVLYVLAAVNSLYIIMNFAVEEIASVALESVTNYLILTEISFGLLVIWIVYNSFKLITGKAYQHFPKLNENLIDFEELIRYQKVYEDPEFNASKYTVGRKGEDLFFLLNSFRWNKYLELKKHAKFSSHEKHSLIYRVGFHSKKIFLRTAKDKRQHINS